MGRRRTSIVSPIVHENYHKDRWLRGGLTNGHFSLECLTCLLRVSPNLSDWRGALIQTPGQTLEAFRNPEIDVIFNTAMTGDGKSLAAYLPTFQDHKHVVALYPTNELIRDQYQSLPGYEQSLGIRLPHNDTMFGAKISELMRNTIHRSVWRKYASLSATIRSC